MKEISGWRLSLEEELIHLSFVKPLGLRPARNGVFAMSGDGAVQPLETMPVFCCFFFKQPYCN